MIAVSPHLRTCRVCLAVAAVLVPGCGRSEQEESQPDDGCPSLDNYDKIHARALTKGFGVREFPLVVDQASTPITASWVPEDDFRFVSCGIFTCPPAIVAGRIDQAKQCTFLHRIVDHTESTFELTLNPGEQDLAGLGACAPAPVTILVGCWAYGDTKIVAATKLTPLEPALVAAEFPTYSPFDTFSAGCEADTPNRDETCDSAADAAANTHYWCVRPGANPGIGTCHQKVCRERCKPGTENSAILDSDLAQPERACEQLPDACFGMYVDSETDTEPDFTETGR